MARGVSTPTIFDIAREAGVSTSAVSYAVNGKAGVSDSTREHILKVARRLRYSPNSSARALASSQSQAFGLVVARPAEVVGSDRFFPAFMAGAQSFLSTRHYTLLLDILVADDELDHYDTLVSSGQVSGFFITDLRVDDPRLSFLAERDVAAVISGLAVPDFDFPAVTLDEDDAIREAVDELVALGHRRIAAVSGPRTMVHAMRRLTTIRSALESHGLELVEELEGDFGGASGAEAMTRLLARKQRPTAVLFGNDQMAIAGAATASAMGYALPTDISVVGVDDIDLAGLVHPALTTISSDAFQLGRRAAEVLLDTPQDGRSHSIGKAQLVRRSSIGPA